MRLSTVICRFIPFYAGKCIMGIKSIGRNTPPSDSEAKRVSLTSDQGSQSVASRHLSSNRSRRTVSPYQSGITHEAHKKADTQGRLDLPHFDRPPTLPFC